MARRIRHQLFCKTARFKAHIVRYGSMTNRQRANTPRTQLEDDGQSQEGVSKPGHHHQVLNNQAKSNGQPQISSTQLLYIYNNDESRSFDRLHHNKPTATRKKSSYTRPMANIAVQRRRFASLGPTTRRQQPTVVPAQRVVHQ